MFSVSFDFLLQASKQNNYHFKTRLKLNVKRQNTPHLQNFSRVFTMWKDVSLHRFLMEVKFAN